MDSAAIQPVGPNPTEDISHEEKKKLLQQQLVLLLHAYKCANKSTNNENAEDQQRRQECTLQHCATMKVLLNHMKTCGDVACAVPHCSSSRKIIAHWKLCSSNAYCPICSPIRDAQNAQQPADAQNAESHAHGPPQ
ncbi:unnamed protein product [Caenorhabditis sp. 36 PRJEB53466]|nr:unnamed protein product [Caenorhabditis sp. 36 PRJEB53466]